MQNPPLPGRGKNHPILSNKGLLRIKVVYLLFLVIFMNIIFEILQIVISF